MRDESAAKRHLLYNSASHEEFKDVHEMINLDTLQTKDRGYKERCSSVVGKPYGYRSQPRIHRQEASLVTLCAHCMGSTDGTLVGTFTINPGHSTILDSISQYIVLVVVRVPVRRRIPVRAL
jgi:hypothetical protein